MPYLIYWAVKYLSTYEFLKTVLSSYEKKEKEPPVDEQQLNGLVETIFDYDTPNPRFEDLERFCFKKYPFLKKPQKESKVLAKERCPESAKKERHSVSTACCVML